MKRLLLATILIIAGANAKAQSLRYFEFTTGCRSGKWQDSSFIAATADTAVINSVISEMTKPYSERRFILGFIDRGSAGHNHNADHWFLWHFKPDKWYLTDAAYEVCDGCPYSAVDANVDQWVDMILMYCPWTGRPAREVSMPLAVAKMEVSDLTVYPNPANDALNFNWKSNDNINVYVTNAMGQVVRTATIYKASPKLDINELPGGIYLLKVADGKQIVIKTIVVKR